MPCDRTDASLVKSTLSGDQSAFCELASRYRDVAFGVAFHRLGDFEAARDAAQDALVTAYRELPMLREPSKFGNWLCRIAASAAITAIRRRRDVLSLDDPSAHDRPAREPDPARIVEDREKSRRVREALQTLPEQDRLAVILHYVDGYSHEEVGRIMEVSMASVKSRVYRARGRLKKEMLEMVESNLKGASRTVELTEELIRKLLTRADAGEHGKVAILDRLGELPATPEYTENTRNAIKKLASELHEEGFKWMVAPPRIPDGSPALELLKSMGFQVETEMHWYERSLRGKLPHLGSLDAGCELRRLRDVDPAEILTLLRATTQKHAPDAIQEEDIRGLLSSPILVPEASLAVCRGGGLAAFVNVFGSDETHWIYETGSAVLWYLTWDPEITKAEAVEYMICACLDSLKQLGFRKAVKEGIQPVDRADLISVLQSIGFRYIRSQWNLKARIEAIGADIHR